MFTERTNETNSNGFAVLIRTGPAWTYAGAYRTRPKATRAAKQIAAGREWIVEKVGS